jgi:hypothetical protein
MASRSKRTHSTGKIKQRSSIAAIHGDPLRSARKRLQSDDADYTVCQKILLFSLECLPRIKEILKNRGRGIPAIHGDPLYVRKKFSLSQENACKATTRTTRCAIKHTYFEIQQEFFKNQDLDKIKMAPFF